MAYRNKTYVAFDGERDIKYYYLMKAWKQSDNTDFNFYDAHDLNTALDSSTTETIKRRLSERMANSKMFILLLGERTKYMTRFVKWEVEHALYLNLPIVVVNINGARGVDVLRMPPWLDDKLCITCPFNAKIIQYTLEHWGELHYKYQNEYDKQGTHRYWAEDVYSMLGM